MRLLPILLLTFYVLPTWGQYKSVLNKPYAVKYKFIDSLISNSGSVDDHEKIKRLEQVLNSFNEDIDKEFSFQLKIAKYRLEYNTKKNTELTLSKLQDLAVLAHKSNLPYFEAEALETLGDFYSGNMQKHDLAYENYLAAYTIYSKFDFNEFPAKNAYIYSLSGAFFRYDDFENAIKYLIEAKNTKAANDRLNNTINNTLGICYRNLKKYDSSEKYFYMILEDASLKKDSTWIGIAKGNIGINYFRQQKYDAAIPLLMDDILLSLSHNQIKNAAGSMTTLATIYYYQGKIEESEQLLTYALHECESKSFWPYYPLAEQIFTCLSKVYSAKNEWKSAYKYADSALMAKDSVAVIFNTQNLSKAKEKIAIVQHKLEADRLENQKKLQLLVRNCLIAGIFLLSVIGLLFINRQRLRQKKLIAEKRQAELELTATALRLETERKHAEAELETAARLLDGFKQSVSEKNNIIETFTLELERLKTGEEQQIDTELLSQLEKAIILTDDQWENFKSLFEKVHKGFFTNLKKKIPDLTQSEIRFLALTKLKLTSKEMASMLGISTNAIRIYRHRLRKKLDLDKDDMIEELVDGI